MRRRTMGDVGVDDHTLLLLHFDGNTKDEVSDANYSMSGVQWAEGKFGQSASFSGNGYVMIGGTDAINESLYPDYTIDFWIYLNNTVDQGIMSKGVANGYYSLDLSGQNDGKVMFRIQNNGNNYLCYFTINGATSLLSGKMVNYGVYM